MGLSDFFQGLLGGSEGTKAYRTALQEALSDGKLSKVEEEKLASVAKQYGLESAALIKLHKQALGQFFSSVSSDQRITQDEKKALEVLMEHFNLRTNDFDFNQENFNKYSILALLESGSLPVIKSDNHNLNLQFKKGEELHYCLPAELMKLRKVTDRISYGGLAGSIKIAKGVRYRVGSMKVAGTSKETLTAEDSGSFWLTNQRFGFLGQRKSFSLPYNKVMSMELTSEGLLIHKDGKSSPYIVSMRDYEIPCMILSNLINQ